jgi:hypothetical protein
MIHKDNAASFSFVRELRVVMVLKWNKRRMRRLYLADGQSVLAFRRCADVRFVDALAGGRRKMKPRPPEHYLSAAHIFMTIFIGK